MAPKIEPPLSAEVLESLANVFSSRYSHFNLEHLLKKASIPDVDPSASKKNRLYNAFAAIQDQQRNSNNILKFIALSMAPESHVSDPSQFHEQQIALNKILAFSGYCIYDDGKLHRSSKAETISDAVLKAQRFRALLESRNIHSDVVKFADAEIIAENYFHAVLESMKSITSKIRNQTELYADGAQLVDAVFGGNDPILRINKFETETEKGEQRGFAMLLKGLYGTFRNPVAHEAKIEWQMSENDALDILSTISLIHRKLDNAKK